MNRNKWNRRDVLSATLAAGIAPVSVLAAERNMHTRPIPSSGEPLPVIGLGTYDVFDLESTPENIASRKKIVDLLLDRGGSVIDTSPQYDRSESLLGDIIEASGRRDAKFIATKVWIDGRDQGEIQMRRSADLMKTDVIDLMQVHNLRDTDQHMGTIREQQQDGLVRYTGLTHWRAEAYGQLEAEMKKYRPEFIQVNYSLGELEADERILPLAADLGIAVLVNRPFKAGQLFRKVRWTLMPGWAREYADSWGQFFLKFIVSHPAVNAAIPGTSKPKHMRDNLLAGFGPVPDAATRKRMLEFFSNL